jgi:omega-6 fatty acid desaturase (delta-12 desaturase)
MFAPHQFGQVILSDIGVLLWLGVLVAWTYSSGFSEVTRLYLVPYLW